MIRFLKNQLARRSDVKQVPLLGRLEFDLMQILWSRGECNVRDVVQRLDRPLAYTTVMTTLDRLYKKGLLQRHKVGKAFHYAPALSEQEYKEQLANHLLGMALTCLLYTSDAADE